MHFCAAITSIPYIRKKKLGLMLKFDYKLFLLNYFVPFSLALLFLGPALKPGSIFNLDLVLVPHPHLSGGFWGVGPELPRMCPISAVLTMISPIVPSTISVKLLYISIFQLSWLGMKKLSSQIGVRNPYLASLLYMSSPFLLTRLSVGHIGISVMFALLPWTVSTLLAPLLNLRRLFLYSSFMAFAGYASGGVALLVVFIGCLFTKSPLRSRLFGMSVTAFAQTIWLVPGVLVAMGSSRKLSPTSGFSSNVGQGISGFFSSSSGGGFWNPNFQVGPSLRTMQITGLFLLVTAWGAQRKSQYPLKDQLFALGIIGWLFSVQSKIWGINTIFNALTDNPIGQLARESQRFAILHLIWLVPTFCLGIEHLYERLGQIRRLKYLTGCLIALPIAISSILSAPAFWGIGRSLESVAIPKCWNSAKELIADNPGTTLSLPWYQYFDQSIGTDKVRRSLDPMPYFLGGDVLGSSNNGFGAEINENGDPREANITKIISDYLNNRTLPSAAFQRSGISWVILQTTVVIDDYSDLDKDKGLRKVLACPQLTLYQVVPDQAVATASRELTASASNVIPGITRVKSGPFVLNRPWSQLWFIGNQLATKTVDGRIIVPRGENLVWNLGAVITIFSYCVYTIVFAKLFVSNRISSRKKRIQDNQ